MKLVQIRPPDPWASSALIAKAACLTNPIIMTESQTVQVFELKRGLSYHSQGSMPCLPRPLLLSGLGLTLWISSTSILHM
jgi:hypothetical protein